MVGRKQPTATQRRPPRIFWSCTRLRTRWERLRCAHLPALAKGSLPGPGSTKAREKARRRSRAACSERRVVRARPGAARARACAGRAGSRGSGCAEATLALQHLETVGAMAEAARARELLGNLGASTSPRRTGARDQLLTPRELEVCGSCRRADGRTDRGPARAQQAHGSPPSAERLREARLLLTGLRSRTANRLHLL